MNKYCSISVSSDANTECSRVALNNWHLRSLTNITTSRKSGVEELSESESSLRLRANPFSDPQRKRYPRFGNNACTCFNVTLEVYMRYP